MPDAPDARLDAAPCPTCGSVNTTYAEFMSGYRHLFCRDCRSVAAQGAKDETRN